jgi:hypothetical protein
VALQRQEEKAKVVASRDHFRFITVSAGSLHGEIEESFLVGIYYSPVELIQTSYQIQQIWCNRRETCIFLFTTNGCITSIV